MDLASLLAGCRLASADDRQCLNRAWTDHVAAVLPAALPATYRVCQAHPALRSFLWGQDEASWTAAHGRRWKSVFVAGVDQDHYDRVMGFAEGDLDAGLDTAVYGMFFAELSDQIITRILRPIRLATATVGRPRRSRD